jgi:Tfp pilus assembly protein PilZ
VGEEQRESERHEVTFPVICDDGDNYIDGQVLNLSLGGAFVHTRKLLPIGTEVTVSPVGDAADTVYEMQAKVIRIVETETKEDPPGMGLQFTRMTKSAFKGLQTMFDEMPKTSQESINDLPIEQDLSEDELIRNRVRIRARRR